jgi:hypothetical protein
MLFYGRIPVIHTAGACLALFLLILFPTYNLYRRVINPILTINTTTITNMLSKVLRNTTPSLRALRQVTPVAKAFSSSPIAKAQGEITREPIETPLSLWNFTEEEEMIRQTGQLPSPLSLHKLMSSQAIC